MEWSDWEGWLDNHDPDYPIDDGRDDSDKNRNKPVNPDNWSLDDITGE